MAEPFATTCPEPGCQTWLQGGPAAFAAHAETVHGKPPSTPPAGPLIRRPARRRRPWVDDVDARLLPPEQARARFRRGRALVDAAIAGAPVPGPAEQTACRVCHRPHEGPPGSVCDRCDQQGRA